MQLAKNIDLNLATITASTTNSIALEVDSAGCEGILFVGICSSSTGGSAGTMTVAMAASTTATFENVDGGTKSTTEKGVAAVDIHKPRKRYVRGTMATTANQHIHALAFKYSVRKGPVTWSSTVSGGVTSVVSPSST